MIIYHGSYVEVSVPDISRSRRNLDFGQAFYTTSIQAQAERWARRFLDKKGTAVVSCYDFDVSALERLNVLRFDTYSAEWLDYILSCRSGRDTTDYDIVIGGIANDRVFNTVELFFQGLIERDEAIKRLRYEVPNNQIAFRNQAVLDRYVKFLGSDSYAG